MTLKGQGKTADHDISGSGTQNTDFFADGMGKKIDSDIFEIRSKVSSNIQRALYFHVSNNRYVITHGFTKKTQKTPKSEIQRAKTIKKEFEEEVKHANH